MLRLVVVDVGGIRSAETLTHIGDTALGHGVGRAASLSWPLMCHSAIHSRVGDPKVDNYGIGIRVPMRYVV